VRRGRERNKEGLVDRRFLVLRRWDGKDALQWRRSYGRIHAPDLKNHRIADSRVAGAGTVATRRPMSARTADQLDIDVDSELLRWRSAKEHVANFNNTLNVSR
jgi:hypothetical protein